VSGSRSLVSSGRKPCTSGLLSNCPTTPHALEANQGQIEFNPTAAASEDVEGAHAEAPASAKAVPEVDNAPVDAEDALPIHDVQPAQSYVGKAKSRKPQKRAAGTVEQEIASGPIPEAEMLAPSVESTVAQRRMTKRLAAAAQLPRHERWKGRLHPAAW
jgi:hypothetical protein